MTDIVEKLLAAAKFGGHYDEAAYEIKRLREAGKAALDSMDTGDDAGAYQILKHNFGSDK